jgi:hypothetical protein
MLTIAMLREGARAAGIAAATLLFTLPALAGEIYSWRTEDGGYAFTDDAKSIPARYQDQVATRANEGLGSYERLTTPEAGTSADYARRLGDRLDHLRALNRDLDAAYAPRPADSALQTLAVQTGKLNIGVPMDAAGDGPVVIEKVRFRHKGEMATRHNLVVRKGSEILAIIKGNPLVTQINQAPGISEMIPER